MKDVILSDSVSELLSKYRISIYGDNNMMIISIIDKKIKINMEYGMYTINIYDHDNIISTIKINNYETKNISIIPLKDKKFNIKIKEEI